MFDNLRNFFDSFAPPDNASRPGASEHAVRLAAAVLLVEVMRAEPAIGAVERQAVIAALRQRFSLGEQELSHLVELAEVESRESYDYFRFTSTLNDRFTQPQKIALVEAMWQVAYADAHLDANENHVISKVADLLHVTHGEYIAAKLRAKASAGLG